VAELQLAPPPLIVRALIAAIALLAILGIVAAFERLSSFDLDREVSDVISVPAMFSAGLLLGAAVLALLCRDTGSGSVRWLALGALFAFLALDELLAFHETLERELATDWQTLYAPLALVGALIWLSILRAMSAIADGQLLWIAGATAWGVSQLLENLAWGPGDVPIRGFRFITVGEEILEMTGSMLFVWALLIVLTRPGSEPSPAAERASSPA
jgi:hypothetical protein